MNITFKNSAAIATLALFAACGTPEADTAEKATEAAPAATETTSASYVIDTESSRAMWKGTMLGAYSHNGTLNFSRGEFTVTDGKVTAGAFVVDMTSIMPTDENYGEENPKEALIGHLSSPDFFDVANHSSASFEITGENTGNLTIRGNTNPVTLKEVVVREGDSKTKATASFVFDRTKFDVSFVNPVKEKVLSDEIEVSVELLGNPK